MVRNKRTIAFLLFFLVLMIFCSGCSGEESLASVNSTGPISEEVSVELKSSTQKPLSESSEIQSEVSPTEHLVKGTVEEASMNTLVVLAEDGHSYQFSKEDAEITTGETGILLGNPVEVSFYGELDPQSVAQTVKVISIVVSDAEDRSDSSESEETRSESLEKARLILSEMTLEEKVGQMFLARCPDQGAEEKAAAYHLGGYILFARDFEGKTTEQVVQEIQSYQDVSQIPMLIGVDEEGGTVNRVSRYPQFRESPFCSPQEIYEAEGFDGILRDTQEKAQLLKSLGINLNFAPVCDVSENPNDFIYDRSFGKGAQETAQYVEKVVSVMKEQKIGSVLKHFPGYGNNGDTHTGIVSDNRSLETFTESDFLPFEAGIQAGSDVVLVSHNIVTCMDSQYPASLSPKVHQILREKLGFSGVIVTDDLAMDAIRDFTDDSYAAVLAVQAGNDLLCCTDFEEQIPAVLEAVKQGALKEETIDDSVLRILEMKLSLGLL